MSLREKAFDESNIKRLVTRNVLRRDKKSYQFEDGLIRRISKKSTRVLRKEFINEGGTDKAIIELSKSNPIYNGVRDEAMCLLMGAQRECALERVFCRNKRAIVTLNLMIWVPHIPGIRRQRWYTSVNGFKLLDLWAENFPKFAPYVELFDNQKIRKKAIAYEVMERMGIEDPNYKLLCDVEAEIDRQVEERMAKGYVVHDGVPR